MHCGIFEMEGLPEGDEAIYIGVMKPALDTNQSWRHNTEEGLTIVAQMPRLIDGGDLGRMRPRHELLHEVLQSWRLRSG